VLSPLEKQSAGLFFNLPFFGDPPAKIVLRREEGVSRLRALWNLRQREAALDPPKT